jgi:L-ascorbate metabolism protein UlaG (beta-lactamase superfamily)
MSLSIQALNNDSTFLLTFSPTPNDGSETTRSPGTITVLVDPWLVGPASIFSRTFSSQERTSDALISSLADMSTPPDLVLISQDSPDHCHRATLQTLPHDTPASILAPASAAKRIRGWKHFSRAGAVTTMPQFMPADPYDSSFRLPAHGRPSKTSLDIAFLTEPWDFMGIHNSYGLIYTTPSSTTSVLFAPHGATPAIVAPWLRGMPDATPLTVLMHPFNQVTGPAVMFGPSYLYGADRGAELARQLGANTWISAHDERKVLGGLATLGTTTKRYGVNQVKGMVERDVQVERLKAGDTWVWYDGN